MFSMFGAQKKVQLTLVPHESAKKFAGFGSGTPLKLTGQSGITIGGLISQFNAYRAPDSQLKQVFSENGTPTSLSTVLNRDISVIVKDNSF